MLAPYLMRRSNRPQGVRAMTVGSGVITDFYRGQRAAGGYPDDGLPIKSGLAVYPASNAAVADATLNGNFETNTTGWTADNGGAGTVSDDRITTDAKFGSACAETILDGASANQGVITSALTGLTAGNVYTEQLRLKWVSGATAIRVQIDWYTVLDVIISSSTSDVTLTAAWQMFILTATAPALGVHAKLRILNTAATATRFRRDGVQINNGSVALPFDPANTRVAGRIQLPVARIFTPTIGAVCMRLIMGYASSNTGTYPIAMQWRVDANNRLGCARYDDGTNKWSTDRLSGGVADTAKGGAASFSIGDHLTIASKWSATSIGTASGADSAFTTAVASHIPDLSSVTTVDMLSDAGGSSWLSSSGMWYVYFKGNPTDADWLMMKGWGNAVPTLAQISQLSAGAKATCLVPCRTQDAILLPAFFEG